MRGGAPPGAPPLDPVGGAAPKLPPAFKKSGGKLVDKLFGFLNGICRRAAHRGRPACFVGWNPGRKRGGSSAWAAEDGNVPAGGRRGRTAPTRQGRGPLAPPLPWFCGPPGPAKRRPPGRPRATTLPFVSPRSAEIRRLPVGAGGSRRFSKGAAAFGGRGP